MEADFSSGPNLRGAAGHRPSVASVQSFDKLHGLQIDRSEDPHTVTIGLTGAAIARQVDKAIGYFRAALERNKKILIDLSQTRVIDPRFFGLFLMVRKELLSQGNTLHFTGVTPRIKRIFRLNGFEFLLPAE